jgi:tRNA 2-selenouridine synthase
MEYFLKTAGAITVAQLAEFDEIIDVRSPSEFAADHIPGASNYPVLNDEERARIGTIYKQVSPFDARKLGAALIARNIARHLEQHFVHRPREWHPLVYCWRGGKRSGAMTHVLSQIGWRAQQLEGGYKTYRHAVLEALAILPQQFRWRVVCGLTGSGKSRLLQALREAGAQVLDLEQLTCHRGSVLGNMPGAPQPSQKYFDSLMCAELKQFDPAKPVYVEAESKKIGDLRVPQTMIDAMWQSDCIRLEVELASRVQLLMEEYAHFLIDTPTLEQKLDCLIGLHSKEIIGHWKELASQKRWEQLVEELLVKHYDPAYTRSTLKHYARHAQGMVLRADDLSEQAMLRLARAAIAGAAAPV